MLSRAENSFAENTRSRDSSPDKDSIIGICQIWKSPKGTSGCLLGNGVLMFDSVKNEYQILISKQGLGDFSIHELNKNDDVYIYFCSPDNRKSKGIPFSKLVIKGARNPENELVVVRVDKKEKFKGVCSSSGAFDKSAKWSRGDKVSCHCVKESSPGLFEVEHYKDLECNFNPKKRRLYVDVPSTNSSRLVVGSLILNAEKEVLGLLESEGDHGSYYVNTIQAVDETTESETDSPSNNQQHLKLVKEMLEDPNLMHRLSLHLDRSNRASKNYEHLANFLDVPADILAKCKLNTEHSPTEMMFDLLEVHREELTVTSLIGTLRRLRRNDVVGIIKQHISDAETLPMKVCDAIKEKPKLLDDIATKLDETSRFNNNWFRVGQCLELSAKELDDLQCGTNSTLLLMKYIYYSHKPDVTLGEFKEMMTRFTRKDVLRVLQGLSKDKSQQKMRDIIPPESEDMASICRKLNKSVPGLKSWKNVAYDLNVPREIYENFNSKQLESPTKMLFQWLSQSKPDLTVEQLRVALENIRRMDVVLMLKESLASEQ